MNKIKGRTDAFTLPLIVGSLEMAERFCEMNKEELDLAKIHWPGPLVIVCRTKGDVLPSETIRNGTVGLRVSGNTFARELSLAIDGPIVATSANRCGEPTCYSINEIEKQFSKNEIMPDAYVDAGDLEGQPTSTIVKFEDGKFSVLRQGSIYVSS